MTPPSISDRQREVEFPINAPMLEFPRRNREALGGASSFSGTHPCIRGHSSLIMMGPSGLPPLCCQNLAAVQGERGPTYFTPRNERGCYRPLPPPATGHAAPPSEPHPADVAGPVKHAARGLQEKALCVWSSPAQPQAEVGGIQTHIGRSRSTLGRSWFQNGRSQFKVDRPSSPRRCLTGTGGLRKPRRTRTTPHATCARGPCGAVTSSSPGLASSACLRRAAPAAPLALRQHRSSCGSPSGPPRESHAIPIRSNYLQNLMLCNSASFRSDEKRDSHRRRRLWR